MRIYLQRYEFVNRHILRLHYSNGGFLDVKKALDSGFIVQREKSIGFTTVKHTGILLGDCSHTNKRLVIHNHPNTGYADIVYMDEFAQGKPVYYEQEPCVNTPQQATFIGLNAVLKKIPYNGLKSNCQNLTNTACKNKSYSHDLDKIAENVLKGIGVGVMAFLGANIVSTLFDSK